MYSGENSNCLCFLSICLKQFCEKYDIEMPETKNVNSIEAQLFNVEMGNGICLSDYSSRVFGDGRYDFWELPDMISRCCVIARKDNPNPVVKAFLNFVGNRVVNWRKRRLLYYSDNSIPEKSMFKMKCILYNKSR